MQLSPEQADGSVHSKIVHYKFKPLTISSCSNNNNHNDYDDDSSTGTDKSDLAIIKLHQKFDGDLLGGCTWRGAALLARMLLCERAMKFIERKHFQKQQKYLPVVTTNKNSNNNISPFSSCIELGSGAGLVSIAAAASMKFSSKITITEDEDEEILALLETNVRENITATSSSSSSSSSSTVVRQIWNNLHDKNNNLTNSEHQKKSPPLPFQVPVIPLRWGEMKQPLPRVNEHLPPSQYYDLILCAEVLYDPELVDPFLATLLALSGSTHNPYTGCYSTIILTNDTRAGDAASTFFRKASKYFTIERFGFPMAIQGCCRNRVVDCVDDDDEEMQREILREFAPDWASKLKSNEEGLFILQRRAEVVDLRTQLATMMMMMMMM